MRSTKHGLAGAICNALSEQGAQEAGLILCTCGHLVTAVFADAGFAIRLGHAKARSTQAVRDGCWVGNTALLDTAVEVPTLPASHVLGVGKAGIPGGFALKAGCALNVI